VFRTLLPFAPALLCAGTLVFCMRMMSGKHHDAQAGEAAESSQRSEADPPARVDR
jgi:hypothetical protein